MLRRRYSLIAVLFVPFLALYGNSRSLWYDEVHSMFYAGLDLRTSIEYLKHDTHSPAFFLILAGWVKVAGDSEFALRILPAAFYMLSIGAMYLLGRSQYGKRIGLLAALITMTSPLLIMQAHFLRCYTILCFFAVCSLWLFLLIFRQGKSSKVLIILLATVNALGFLIHLWFSFLILAECLAAIILFKKWALPLIVLALSVGPYCLLWLPYLLVQFANRPNGQAWLGPPGPFDFVITLIFFGGAFWLVLGLLLLTNRGISWKKAWIKDPVLLIFVLTILVPFVISQLKYIYAYRYTIPAFPAFGLIAAQMLSALTRRVAVVAVICFLLLISSSWMVLTWARNANLNGCNDKSMAQYLVQNAESTDAVLYVGVQRLPIQYYLDRLGSHLVGFSLPRGIDEHPDYLNNYFFENDRQHLADEAHALLSEIHVRLWVLYGWNKEMNDEIESILAERYYPDYVRDMDCRRQVSDFGSVHFTKIVRYLTKRDLHSR